MLGKIACKQFFHLLKNSNITQDKEIMENATAEEEEKRRAASAAINHHHLRVNFYF